MTDAEALRAIVRERDALIQALAQAHAELATLRLWIATTR